MYVANRKEHRFLATQDHVGETPALQVVHVGKLSEKPPYYGNPVVRADIYDLWSGKPQQLNVRLPCPGTYKTWRTNRTAFLGVTWVDRSQRHQVIGCCGAGGPSGPEARLAQDPNNPPTGFTRRL